MIQPIWIYGVHGAAYPPQSLIDFSINAYEAFIPVDFSQIMEGQVQFEFITTTVDLGNTIQIEILLYGGAYTTTSDMAPLVISTLSLKPFTIVTKSFSLSAGNYYIKIFAFAITTNVITLNTTINKLSWPT